MHAHTVRTILAEAQGGRRGADGGRLRRRLGQRHRRYRRHVRRLLGDRRHRQPCGGMSALVAAAKAEGHLTVTTDPVTWANYGLLIPGFEKKYGIKILDTNPNGTSADEINEINLYKGKPARARRPRLGVAFAQQAVTGEPGVFKGPIFERYKLSEWNELPASWKNANGYWSYDYAGVVTIGYNADVIKTPVTRMVEPA